MISGSCSPVTAAQIEFALACGFGDVPIDTEPLLNGSESNEPIKNASEEATAHLAAGRNVVVHTSRGSSDPRMSELARVGPPKYLAQRSVECWPHARRKADCVGYVLPAEIPQVMWPERSASILWK